MRSDLDASVERVRALHARLCGPPRPLGDHTMRPATGWIDLPAADDLALSLPDALAGRRSSYAFADRPLELGTLSSLLRWAVGVQRTVPAYGMPDHPLGMAPAAGGLPSLRVDVIVGRAGQLDTGGYTYEREPHALACHALGDPPLHDLLVQPKFADRAPVILAISGRLDVVLSKYSPRHYRTLHVDAGIAVQNLYLAATALSLAGCAIAGYHDQALTDLLGLPAEVLPLMMFAVGYPP